MDNTTFLQVCTCGKNSTHGTHKQTCLISCSEFKSFCILVGTAMCACVCATTQRGDVICKKNNTYFRGAFRDEYSGACLHRGPRVCMAYSVGHTRRAKSSARLDLNQCVMINASQDIYTSENRYLIGLRNPETGRLLFRLLLLACCVGVRACWCPCLCRRAYKNYG
jgi:hypothetical protein